MCVRVCVCASSVMDNSTTMAHWVMTATATEADVMRAAWVRKLEDRLIVSDNEGATVLFRSPLSLNNLQRKVSELKKTQGCEHAQVKQLDEAEWLQQRAAAETTAGAEMGGRLLPCRLCGLAGGR